MFFRDLRYAAVASVVIGTPLAGQQPTTGAAPVQVLQRGAMGRLAQLLDETGQWIVPMRVSEEKTRSCTFPMFLTR